MPEFDYTQPEIIDAVESDYLYTKISGIPHAGMGLFTAINIYRNERISVFITKLLNETEAAKLVEQKLDGYFMNSPEGILDSRECECFAKYANDAEGMGIIGKKNNAKICMDDDGNVFLVAMRNIKSGEEIFCSYGKAYWENFLASKN